MTIYRLDRGDVETNAYFRAALRPYGASADCGDMFRPNGVAGSLEWRIGGLGLRLNHGNWPYERPPSRYTIRSNFLDVRVGTDVPFFYPLRSSEAHMNDKKNVRVVRSGRDPAHTPTSPEQSLWMAQRSPLPMAVELPADPAARQRLLEQVTLTWVHDESRLVPFRTAVDQATLATPTQP